MTFSQSASLLPSVNYRTYTPQPNITSEAAAGRRYVLIDSETSHCRNLSTYTSHKLTIYIQNRFPEGYPPKTPYILFAIACIVSIAIYVILIAEGMDLTYIGAIYVPLICLSAGGVHIAFQKLCPKKSEILPA